MCLTRISRRRIYAAVFAVALLLTHPPLAVAQAPVLYPPFDGLFKPNANVDHECPFYDTCKDGHMTHYTGEGCVECQDSGQPWTAPYCYSGHSGTDYAHCGEPVLAAAGGTVVFANLLAGYGYTVKIDHGDGYVTWYCHLVSADPSMEGQLVSRGDVIGTSGTSGTVACHLHFDLRHYGRYTDPYGWLGSVEDPLDEASLNGKYGESLPCLWYNASDSIIIVEDKSPAKFSGTVPTTYWGRGHSWSMLYTHNNPSDIDYTGTWRPNLPDGVGTDNAGYYSVLVYIPPETASTTAARYVVGHADGTSPVEVNQAAHRNQWVWLGGYLFRGESDLDSVTLRNYTPNDAGATHVAFDAVKFVQYRRFVPLAMKDAAMGPVGGTWATGIQVQNHSADHIANVSMAFFWARGTGHDGELALIHTDTVPAGGSVGYYLPSTGPSGIPELPAGFIGSVVISSDQPIGANVNTQTATTSPMRVGTVRSVSVPAGTLYFPQLNRAAGGYTFYMALQNTSGEATEVTIRYYNASNGQEVPAAAQSATIPAYTTWTVYQAGNGNLPAGWAGSAIVTADRSLAGVAAMYNTTGGDAGANYSHYNGFEEGATTVNLPRLVRHYYGYEGGLAVQNVGSAPTDVTIHYHFAGATYTQVVPNVAPRAAVHVYLANVTALDPLDSLPEWQRSGSATITASQPVVATGNETYHGADPRLVGRGITYTGFPAGSEGNTVSFPQVLSHYYCQSGGAQVQNVSGVATTVTAEWKRNGVVEATTVVSLGPGEAASWYAPNHVPSNWCGSVVATASGGGALVGIANASWSDDPWTYGDTYLTYEGATD